MSAKKGKDKKAVSPTLTLFNDFEENCKPEPSPSYFTELPMEVTTSALRGGDGPNGDDMISIPPMGVKLYFRPGLQTEAVKEGLLQALRHECTVVQIDLGCALQVDWDALSEPLLRHLVKEDLVSVQVPNLKVSLIKGKCKGKLLDLIRQQIGNSISIFHRKFKTNHFLNTDWLINKITTAGHAVVDDADKEDEKLKDTIKVLKEAADSDWNNSTLLHSQEFRVALIKAYKAARKKSRFDKRQKRKFDLFYEDEEEQEKDEEIQNPKKRRRKHPLPVLDEISEDSDDSDLELEQSSTTEQPILETSLQRDSQKDETMSISPSSSPDPNTEPDKDPTTTSDPTQQSENKDTESSQPEASTSSTTSPPSSTSVGFNPQKGQVPKCYVCRQRFYTASKKRITPATRHYKRMCIPCAEFNWKKRHQVNDLSGMVAVVTGGRIKIGYHIVLKLLRCGCKVIATTRFPHDAAKMFAQESDYSTWADRLIIYPLDLKNAEGIYKFTNYLKRTLDKLDILINNAAQTIHRPIEFYRHLLDYEKLSTHALPEQQQRILVGGINFNMGLPVGDQSESQTGDLDYATKETETKLDDMDPIVELPRDLTSNRSDSNMEPKNNSSPKVTAAASVPSVSGTSTGVAEQIVPPTQMRAVPPMRMSSFERETLFPSGRFDADGQQLDLRRTNTWRTVLDEVPVGELLEVLMVNTVAPFILNKELKELMVKSNEPRKFVVNVSAMEGQFSRQAKTEYHPHTNMAKAALNMMTRTAALSYRQDDIFMTSVDTGWVTDERPFHMARHEDRKGFLLPLDSVNGAARVLDPILDGLTSKTEPHYAVFLKDYRPYPW